jgi:cholesterol oxidase
MTDERFDAVVVGSGFGGSVMAYRLAEAGMRVCVLERGKAYPPGSFPRTPREFKASFWDPSEGLQGLWDAWSFRDIGALVSSGLGGGSLIYANVLLRKDERWFVREDLAHGGHEYWPVTRGDLDQHYDRVEHMIGVETYPYAATTPKTLALRDAAKRLQLKWELPPLAVTFSSPGQGPVTGEPVVGAPPNLHGRTRQTCRLCGECIIGCNYGSKNTLDYTYLSEASRLGAELRTRCEVRSLAPRAEGGYDVSYVRHLAENEGRATDTRSLPLERLSCERLILSAGALGTPYLLLANSPHLPGLSRALGTRFSGNGDLLTFALEATNRSTGADAFLDPAHGPTITSYLRVPDALDGGEGRGFYVEDAGLPSLAVWLLHMSSAVGGLGRAARFAARWASHQLGLDARSELGADISTLLGSCSLSGGSLPLLGMGRDVPDGRMFLEDGWLEIAWQMRRSRRFFERVRSTMRDIAGTMGARFLDDPLWYLNRVVTVHPLGGCPMGRDPSEGVVDAWGEAYGHPGLYVADGSVMPGPVGPNPSLTIAALADRFADRIVQGWRGRRATS